MPPRQYPEAAVRVPVTGAPAAGHAFTAESGGVRLHGFFVSPVRATGTLTRTVGRCAIVGAQWTARPAP